MVVVVVLVPIRDWIGGVELKAYDCGCDCEGRFARAIFEPSCGLARLDAMEYILILDI
jgi:hypothetical protein